MQTNRTRPISRDVSIQCHCHTAPIRVHTDVAVSFNPICCPFCGPDDSHHVVQETTDVHHLQAMSANMSRKSLLASLATLATIYSKPALRATMNVPNPVAADPDTRLDFEYQMVQSLVAKAVERGSDVVHTDVSCYSCGASYTISANGNHVPAHCPFCGLAEAIDTGAHTDVTAWIMLARCHNLPTDGDGLFAIRALYNMWQSDAHYADCTTFADFNRKLWSGLTTEADAIRAGR